MDKQDNSCAYIYKHSFLPIDWLRMDKKTNLCTTILKFMSKLKKMFWLSKVIDKQSNRVSNTD